MAKVGFLLCAKDLSITWGDDCRYWRWLESDGSSCHSNKMAELIEVCWLEVQGKFDMSVLSWETLYEVSFVVKLKSEASVWNIPAKFSLILPDGTKQVNEVDMSGKPKEQWMEIPVGKFRTVPENSGEIKFSVTECDNNYWKKGLIVKGIQILPKMI